MDVVVQPSVPWMKLNDEIKESGLFFPVDPGPSVCMHLPSAFRHTDQQKTTWPSGVMLTSILGSNRRHGRHQLQVSVAIM